MHHFKVNFNMVLALNTVHTSIICWACGYWTFCYDYMHSLMRNACQISGSYMRLCLHWVVQSAYGVCSFTSGAMLLFSPVFCDVVSLFLTTVYHCSALECFSFSVHGKPPENADGLELIWWLHHNWICCETIKIFVNMCWKSCPIHFWGTQQKWEFTYKCVFYRSKYAHGIWKFR